MIHIPWARPLALPFRGKIPAKGKALKSVGQQNAPQIRVSFKMYAEQIENFAF